MKEDNEDQVRTLFKNEVSVQLCSTTNMQDKTKDGKKFAPGEIGVLTWTLGEQA